MIIYAQPVLVQPIQSFEHIETLADARFVKHALAFEDAHIFSQVVQSYIADPRMTATYNRIAEVGCKALERRSTGNALKSGSVDAEGARSDC